MQESSPLISKDALIMLAILLAPLPGCEALTFFMANVDKPINGLVSSITVKRMEEPAFLFPVTDPVTLEVSLFRGSVEIRTNPRRENISVTFTRRADHGFLRDDEPRQSLHEITTQCLLVQGEDLPMLSVRAWTVHPEPLFQSVSVLVEAPDIDGLVFRSSSGSCTAIGIHGMVDLEVDEGSLLVATNHALTGTVTMITGNGNIDYRVHAASTGHLTCEATGGRCHQRIRGGKLIIMPGTDHDSFTGILNGGDNQGRLHATRGDVRIAVDPDPAAFGSLLLP